LSSVPYFYVNLTALCCYTLIFTAFLAAKKTPEIRAFIVVMLGFIFWTGGSILMRLQVFPGVGFWFYVSILSLFSLALLIYFFVCSFARVKGYFLKLLWTIGTIGILIVTALGIFLSPPRVETLADGGTVFLYEMKWPIIIPCIFFLFIVVSILKVFLDVIRKNGIRTPGLLAIISGCIAVTIGNMIQIIPGNTFPWDTLSGIFFASFLIAALYRKRMFRLTLIISRSVLMIVSAIICILAAVYFVGPIEIFFNNKFSLSSSTSTTIVVVLFTALLALIYICMKKLIDALFTREEQQSILLKKFSNSVSQSLDTDEILDRLILTIKQEIPVETVHICLLNGDKYISRCSSNPFAVKDFSISADSPCVSYILSGENCFLLSDFKSTTSYLSMWEEEKNLISRLNLACIAAIKDADNIVGIVLLSSKERGAPYTYVEMTFLETICTIASFAVKNAGLYERVYREARIDSLTGVYNYKHFIEKVSEEFEAAGNECLSLLYLDLDDFKLYNQLYGTNEGDHILRRTADIITSCAGNAGTVFRHSGKVFAVLLPGFDGRRTEALAREIQRQIAQINAVPERSKYKALSISGGICVSPHAASSAKELIENTDMAVYNAKNSGKNKIVIFKGSAPATRRISQRAMEIVEQGGNAYGKSSQTVFALTAAIDAKDHYTGRHSQNVARYSAILACAAGMNDDQVRMIYAAALLHDIGKISIPESILNKTSKLTTDEFNLMSEHVNSSIEMMRYLPDMDYLIPAAVGHHERWDGAGYPRGIAGEDIPLSARCLAIADAFDAMTSDRPYRRTMSIEAAANQIAKNAGTQFDPQLAEIFVDLVRAGEIVLLR